MSPDEFEDFVIEAWRNVGFNVQKAGETYTKDGGIDFIACPKSAQEPLIIAFQVKHSRVGMSVGPSAIRDFKGAISPHPDIKIGIIVTNTSFTADAIWAAKQQPSLVRLRDLNHLRLWLEGEIKSEEVWGEIPDTLELAPGVTIKVPKPKRYR